MLPSFFLSVALAMRKGEDATSILSCLFFDDHAASMRYKLVAAAPSLIRCRPAARLAPRSKPAPSSCSTTRSSTTAKPTLRKSRDTRTRSTSSRARRASGTRKTTGCRGRVTPLSRNSRENSESEPRWRRFARLVVDAAVTLVVSGRCQNMLRHYCTRAICDRTRPRMHLSDRV